MMSCTSLSIPLVFNNPTQCKHCPCGESGPSRAKKIESNLHITSVSLSVGFTTDIWRFLSKWSMKNIGTSVLNLL